MPAAVIQKLSNDVRQKGCEGNSRAVEQCQRGSKDYCTKTLAEDRQEPFEDVKPLLKVEKTVV